jgi:hypothetical protein
VWHCLKSSKYTKYSIAFQASSDKKSTRQSAHVDLIGTSFENLKEKSRGGIDFPTAVLYNGNKRIAFIYNSVNDLNLERKLPP